MTYTKLGDDGYTTTMCGQCVPKDSTICDICGEIDWIQAKLDKSIMTIDMYDHKKQYKTIIKDLDWIHKKLGMISAEISNAKIDKRLKNYITSKDLTKLEKNIKDLNVVVKGFQRFSKATSIEVNEMRIAIRKLERTFTKYLREKKLRKPVYQYINRLSSYFFILAVKLQGD